MVNMIKVEVAKKLKNKINVACKVGTWGLKINVIYSILVEELTLFSKTNLVGLLFS